MNDLRTYAEQYYEEFQEMDRGYKAFFIASVVVVISALITQIFWIAALWALLLVFVWIMQRYDSEA